MIIFVKTQKTKSKSLPSFCEFLYKSIAYLTKLIGSDPFAFVMQISVACNLYSSLNELKYKGSVF